MRSAGGRAAVCGAPAGRVPVLGRFHHRRTWPYTVPLWFVLGLAFVWGPGIVVGIVELSEVVRCVTVSACFTYLLTGESEHAGRVQRRRARGGARTKRRGVGVVEQALLPHHDLRHVGILAPELGIHVALTHLVVAKLATPAVTLRVVFGGAKPAKPRVVKPVATLRGPSRPSEEPEEGPALGGTPSAPTSSPNKRTGSATCCSCSARLARLPNFGGRRRCGAPGEARSETATGREAIG